MLTGIAIGAGITVLSALVSLPLVYFFGKEIIVFIAAGLFLTFLPVTFLAVLLSIFFLARAQQNLPPLRLKEKILYPPTVGAKPLATSDIRQIYSTTSRVLVHPPDRYIDNYIVFALTHQGERVFLLGPLDSAESALFIEEFLEVNMQLLDLPVFGDAALPRRDSQNMPVSPQETCTEGLTCEACGAEMIIAPQDTQRGFAACRHCGGLMLLYADGGLKPILGIPDASKKDSQFTIITDASETVVSDHRTGNPEIRISGGKMRILTPGASRKEISSAGIRQLQVRETGWAGRDSPAVKNLAPGIRSLQEAMAYSGDLNPGMILFGAGAKKTYALTPVLSNEEEVILLEGIREVGEAFFLKGSLLKA